MSYEHCEEHDLDATNGCPKCSARELVKEAFEATADLLEGHHSIAEAAAGIGPLRKMLAFAYLRGLGLLSHDTEIIDAVRRELDGQAD